MRRRIGTSILPGMLLLLAGCQESKPVGGVSAEDAAALDNAAEILDASPDGLAAPEGMQPANGAESNAPPDENGAMGNAAAP